MEWTNYFEMFDLFWGLFQGWTNISEIAPKGPFTIFWSYSIIESF